LKAFGVLTAAKFSNVDIHVNNKEERGRPDGGRMRRSLRLAVALALAAPVYALPMSAHAGDRTLPMRFDVRVQGPAETCGAKCQTLISASGAITADSARDFQQFARGLDLANATVVFDSDGLVAATTVAFARSFCRAPIANRCAPSCCWLACTASCRPKRA
jgi:hypothetical protein